MMGLVGGKTLAGEVFASEPRRRGLAGIVVDGAVRDVHTIRGLGFPVYARWASPMAGTLTSPDMTPTSISCGGVKVAQGDYVIGDDDGVVIATEEELQTIVPAAEEIQRREADWLRRI